jgi:hypothetical protein
MEDMATYEDQEQDEELQPSLASVYQLYDDDTLQEFVDAAEILLDEDVKLNRYHTIQLLILLTNSVEDLADTRGYYDRAQTEYRKAQLYHQESDPDEIRAIEVLGVKLDQMRAVVEAERAFEAGAPEVIGEDTIEEPAHHPTDFKSSVDGADDREGTSNATEIGTVAMALRVRILLTSVPASITLTDCHAAKSHSRPFQICRQPQEEESEAFEEVYKNSSSPQIEGSSDNTSRASWSYIRTRL